jgi:hypothetical protein
LRPCNAASIDAAADDEQVHGVRASRMRHANLPQMRCTFMSFQGRSRKGNIRFYSFAPVLPPKSVFKRTF